MNPPDRDDFGAEAIAQFRKSLGEPSEDRHRGAVPNPPSPEPLTHPVHRRVLKATGATVPWVVQHRIGRNDPCPCGCGKKAKKCERGLALIEAARWA